MAQRKSRMKRVGMKQALKTIAMGYAALALAACATMEGEPIAARPAPEPIPRISTVAGTYLAANFAVSQGEIEGAAEYFSALLRHAPGNTDIRSLTFFYAATAGDMETAIPLARQVVLQDSRNRPAHLVLAAEALKLGNYPQAEEEIGQAGGGAFFSLTNTLIQSWALAGQGRTDDALTVLARLNQQVGLNALESFHRALILEHGGRVAEAEAAYQEALAAPGLSARVMDAFGRFLIGQGRLEEATALYRDVATVSPGTPIADVGFAMIEDGAAEPLISSPAEGTAEGLFSLATSLTGNDSSDVAILYLNLAIYLAPDFDLAHALLGDRYESLDKYETAIEVYSRVPRTSPYFPMLEVQTAVNLGRIGRADEAIERIEALTRADDEDTDAWTTLGDLRRGVEDNEEAVEAYTRAIDLIPEGDGRLAGLYFARAVSYHSLGDWTNSESDLRASLAIDPEQANVLNYLGYGWVEQGANLEEAVILLERARSLRPLDGYIADSVGWAYFKLGRYEEAVEILEQAVQLAPGASEINDHLGDAYWMIGRKLDARFEWSHALTQDPSDAARPLIERKLRIGLDAATATGS